MSDDAKRGSMVVLNILELLTQHPITGLRNVDIAKALDVGAVSVVRAVNVLLQKGWARKSEDERIYPTSHFTRLTFNVLREFDNAERKLKDQLHNMTGNF